MIKYKRLSKYCVAKMFYNENGQLHNENDPAIVYFHFTGDNLDECEKGHIMREDYYINGKRDRLNGPIIVKYANGNVSYQEFKNHKDDIKSIQYRYSKSFDAYGRRERKYKLITYNNGIQKKIHYTNGSISLEEFKLNDVLHNQYGPALIHYDNNGKVSLKRYYINGKEYKDELQIMILEGLKDECV